MHIVINQEVENTVKQLCLIECLKSDYKNHSIVGKEHIAPWDGIVKYPDCTMPWQQSMLEKHWSQTYKQDDVTACNDTQLSTLYSLDYEYLKAAARLNITNCPGRYRIEVKKYD